MRKCLLTTSEFAGLIGETPRRVRKLVDDGVVSRTFDGNVGAFGPGAIRQYFAHCARLDAQKRGRVDGLDNLSDERIALRFLDAMLAKLDRNAHKEHWSEFSAKRMLRRLKQEVGELERAVDAGADPEKVLAEAADVANFAMMVADNARRAALLISEAR